MAGSSFHWLLVTAPGNNAQTYDQRQTSCGHFADADRWDRFCPIPSFAVPWSRIYIAPRLLPLVTQLHQSFFTCRLQASTRMSLKQIDLSAVQPGDVVLYAALIPREVSEDDLEANQSFDYSTFSASTSSYNSLQLGSGLSSSQRSGAPRTVQRGATSKLRPCVVVYVRLSTRQVGLRPISSFGRTDLANQESLVLK